MKAISLGRREIYEFGGFRLDVDERTIERLDGHAVYSLPEKTFQILALLVKRRGHLVTKDEILDQIWPDTAVEENNVERRIYQLRQFLGKTETNGKFIETVRGRGYRFVARVETIEVSQSWLPDMLRIPEEDDPPAITNGHHTETNGSELKAGLIEDQENPIADSAAAGRFSKKIAIACGLAVVVLAAILLGYFGFAGKTTARAPRSIAILPAVPIRTAERDELYEYGIADSLINRLAGSDSLTVRPLNAVRGYAGPAVDAIAAGREQKVDYVLASNYQTADGNIKVTAQLYNIASGQIEETFQTQFESTKVFGAQDAIAADLGNKLTTRFNASTRGNAKPRGTSSEEAYRLYQQAMYLIDKRSPDNSKKAIVFLDQAIALDPNYARAWAARAMAIRNSMREDAAQVHREAIEAINKALAIDPKLADAYLGSCLDKMLYDYDVAGAETSCRQAIRLDPNSSGSHQWLSWVLSLSGRHDEAITEIRTAIDLEPVSYVDKRDYGNALYLARRYDEAAIQWRRMNELDPTDIVPYNQFIRVLEAQEKYSEAFEWFIKLLKLRQSDPETIQRFSDIYQSSGWRGVLLERAKHPELFQNGINFHTACLYARAGEKEKAFEYLERSFQQREWAMAQLQVIPQLDPIRDDPRYQDLVSRVFGK